MKYSIITIEREYASGGSEIGEKVAASLGIPCYGREILEIAAERYGTSPEYLEQLEETTTKKLHYSLSLLSHEVYGQGTGMSKEDELYMAESRIILALATEGPAVIIGRCASHVLQDRDDILTVFIHSEWEKRKARAVSAYNILPQDAEAVLKRYDRRRSNYYNAITNKKWNTAANYHMVLDSGKLGIEQCAKIICACC